MKKLSVIVPVYNAEKYIERCAYSILNQTYSNVELILVNDGSKDGSLALCQRLAEADDRVKVYDKPNGGAASARNLGIREATGEYIGFCDSDDYYDLDMMQTLIGVMEQEGLNTIECTARDLYEGGEVFKTGLSDRSLNVYGPEETLRNIFLHKGNVSLATRVTRSEFIKEITIPEGRRVEDFYFTICLIRNLGKTAVYNYPFYNCVTRQGSVTRSSGASIYFDSLYFWRKAVELLKDDGYDLSDAQDYYLLKVYYLISVSANRADRKRFKTEIAKCKADLRSKYRTMIKCPHLKKKEKIVLSIAVISFGLSRLAYRIKGGR